mmetsp:Transcript_63259/g.184873  ORF Transcript_63259/g.184873 Transcript_63259/m.184873 type:complete len:496 (-) Transcript_63259:59-1546(-)
MPRLCSRALSSARPCWSQARFAGDAPHQFACLPRVESAPVTGVGLRVWTAGGGAPAALLLPPLRPDPQGDWRQWSDVAQSLLRLQAAGSGSGGDASGSSRSPSRTSVWIAEWTGWEASASRGVDKAQHLLALADLAAQAYSGGELKLVAGAGGAGLLVPQALRILQLRDGPASISGVSMAAVAPNGWASPLPRLMGEDYPVRLARRQHLGSKLQFGLAQTGLGSMVARWLVPDSSPDADAAAVLSWWLGFWDPVTCTRDAARELLMGSRAVAPTAASEHYKAARAALSAQDAAADDADDDDFAVGATSSRSKQPPAELVPKADPASGTVSRSHSFATDSTTSMGRPFLGVAAPLLVLLPDSLPQEDREGLVLLQRMVEDVQVRLRSTASQMLSRGSGADAQAVLKDLESELFKALLELDAQDGGQSRGVIEGPSGGEQPLSSPDGETLTGSVLPVRMKALPGSSACFAENPDLVAQHLLEFAFKGPNHKWSNVVG